MATRFQPESAALREQGWLWGGWLALVGGLCAWAAPPVLEWQSEPFGRRLPLVAAPEAKPGFTQLAPELTGVWFTNLLPESRHLTNQILPNGSGVAAGDIDGDGWCDLFFCGLRDGGNRLYRNLGGWRFTNVTEEAGVALPGLDCTGVALADLDGDGDLDLVVNSIGGGTHLFFNDGKGRFAAAAEVLNAARGGTSLGLADADGDGDLDLYIANYRVWTLTDTPGTKFNFRMVDGKPTVVSIDGRPLTDPEWTNRFRFKIEMAPGGRGKFAYEELGEPDSYFLNDGKGRFTPVAFSGGAFLDEAGQPLAAPFDDWGLSVLFRDLNGDGAPDLYLCNDFGTPDRLWLNDGQGRFRLAPWYAIRQTSLASMAVDAADLDRDGYDELVVLDMLGRDHRRRLTQRNIQRAELAPAAELTARPQYPRNTLLWNRGDGTYAEIAQFAGLEGTDWSWNPILVDVDLDGYEDLLVPNGFVRDNMNLDAMNRIAAAKAGRRLSPLEELRLRALYPPLETPNLAFQNLGQLKFLECGARWGFDQAVISQGACLADLDNDGDLDVVVNHLNRVAGLYENRGSAPRLGVRLRGRPPNTGAVGARITVSGGPVAQTQQFVVGGRYCSSDQGQRAFAAGAARALEVRVRWRNGLETVVSNLPPNQLVEIAEPPVSVGEGGVAPPRAPAPAAGAMSFADVSQALQHTHQDAPFDDFERQPLLPRKLSQLGPGAAWWDVDGDGRDDLIIGGGRGGRLALWRNLGDGRFEALADLFGPLERDTAGLAGLAPGKWLVAFANYEDGATNGAGVVQWSQAGAAAVVPLGEASFGPIALADYAANGELGLFVGGRVLPGRYPALASSRLYRRQGAGFELDTTNTAVLPAALVSGAVWTDLTGDGWPELVLACEWGALGLWRNHQGQLEGWDPPITWAPGVSGRPDLTRLSHLTGWWNGVAAGDFDGDGRLDLVAANWGENTRYERWRPAPLRMYYGDFNEDGQIELLEARYVNELRQFAPERMLDAVARCLPRLGERFSTHAAWAEAGIDEVLAPWRAAARFHEAVWLASTLFLNRGDHFEARPLPAEAQFAPAFAVCVGDADGDGLEDVFLSQNFFDVDLDTSRSDAGRGLWLRGDGRGGLAPVRGQDCGVRVYGEQRGAALADFDGDGRIDLVVTQNRAETKLFRNLKAKPGLRVRLAGPPGNPCGLGAVVRLKCGDVLGAAREWRAGGGYWSQDSPTQVMAAVGRPTQAWVRWPGGKLTLHDLPEGAKEVELSETQPTRNLR